MMRRILLLGIALTLSLPMMPANAAATEGGTGKRASASVAKAKAKLRAKHRVHVRAGVTRSPYLHKVSQTVADDGVGGELHLASSKALVMNQETGEILYAKETSQPTPIASVTKLMTAMVVLDAHLPMDEPVTVTADDVDTLKNTGSRLRVGATLTRGEMLQLAIMASENRAASALGHAYPGGIGAFVRAMNVKAKMLGMQNSHFVDPTGLNSDNMSTAEDLAKMVNAAYAYPEIRQVSTTASYEVEMNGARRPAEFHNTNILVRKGEWDIGLSKTGFINEAGRCLVMQAQISGQPYIIILLDSVGKYTRIGDAQRVRKWIENGSKFMAAAKMG